VCIDMLDVAVRVHRDMGRVLLVRGGRVRRVRAAVLRVRDVRLQLVVPVGRGLL